MDDTRIELVKTIMKMLNNPTRKKQKEIFSVLCKTYENKYSVIKIIAFYGIIYGIIESSSSTKVLSLKEKRDLDFVLKVLSFKLCIDVELFKNG